LELSSAVIAKIETFLGVTALGSGTNDTTYNQTAFYTHQAKFWCIYDALKDVSGYESAIATAQSNVESCIAGLAAGMKTAGTQAQSMLNAAWLWRYHHSVADSDTTYGSRNCDTPEYGASAMNGFIHYQEMMDAGFTLLSETALAEVKAFARRLLGSWMLNGYPNWQTAWQMARIHNTQYFLYQLGSLIELAACTPIQTRADDGKIDKYILDRAIDFYESLDTLNGDPADGAAPNSPFMVWGGYSELPESTGIWTTGRKSIANATYVSMLATAIEYGVPDMEGLEPEMIHTSNQSLEGAGETPTSCVVRVSTPLYSAANILRSAAFNGTVTDPLALATQFPDKICDKFGRRMALLSVAGKGAGANNFNYKLPATLVDSFAVVEPEGIAYPAAGFDVTRRLTRSGYLTVTCSKLVGDAGYQYVVVTTYKYLPNYIEMTLTITQKDGDSPCTGSSIAFVLGCPRADDARMVVVNAAGVEQTPIYDGATDAVTGTQYKGMASYRYLHNKRTDADGNPNSGLMFMWLDDTAWAGLVEGRSAYDFCVAGSGLSTESLWPEGYGYCYISLSADYPHNVVLNGPYTMHALLVPTDGSAAHAAALYQELSAAEASKAIRTAYETAVIAEQNKRIIGS